MPEPEKQESTLLSNNSNNDGGTAAAGVLRESMDDSDEHGLTGFGSDTGLAMRRARIDSDRMRAEARTGPRPRIDVSF